MAQFFVQENPSRYNQLIDALTVQQPQQQQQPSMPSMPMGMMGGNGGGFGGMFGGGGGASGGGGIGAAGPWAALAAVIIGNELYANNKGYRDEDTGDYAQDLLGGKVFEQDMHKRWAKKLPGPLEDDARGMSNLMTLDFSNAWDDFRNGTLQPIFDLF